MAKEIIVYTSTAAQCGNVIFHNSPSPTQWTEKTKIVVVDFESGITVNNNKIDLFGLKLKNVYNRLVNIKIYQILVWNWSVLFQMFCWKHSETWCFPNFLKHLPKKMLKSDTDEIFLDVSGLKTNRIITSISADNSFKLYMLLLHTCMLRTPFLELFQYSRFQSWSDIRSDG